MKPKEHKQNLIKQQYLSSKTNHVICVDITHMGSYGSAFVAMDLAARNIVGHCYKPDPLNVVDILDCLAAIIRQRSFLPKIRIIHSDRESFFKNAEYYEFLNQQSIEISRGSSKGHDNQVIERTFRTLKGIIRKLLRAGHPDWPGPPEDPLTQKGFNIKEIDDALHKAIEAYNNKPHKALYLMTPNHMEEALFHHGSSSSITESPAPAGLSVGLPPAPVPLLAKNGASQEALDIAAFKQKVISEYAGNWPQFFRDFRAENTIQFNKIVVQNEGLYHQNQNLYHQNLKLQESLNFVKAEMEVMRDRRVKAEEQKHKRKTAQKRALRESIAPEEFVCIINHIKAKGFVPSRKRAAFILLYCTGLRVSNLLALSINHVRELMDKGRACIPLNKGGAPRHTIALSTQGKKLIREHLPDFTRLMLDKEGTNPFFTTQIQLHKPIDRSSFDNELNIVLKKISLELHKHIRTHSFRATIISELLETTPIQIVRDLIGHRSIKTTVQYNRSKVTNEQLEDVLANIDKTRYGGARVTNKKKTKHHI